MSIDCRYGWLYANYDRRRLIGIELDFWTDSFDFRLTLLGVTIEGSVGDWRKSNPIEDEL